MLLASHALAAGPLAASQPGFTVLDPLSAGLLGVCLFGEHIRTGVFDLAGEALALAVVFAGASALSHSCLILGEDGNPSCLPDGFAAPARASSSAQPRTRAPGAWPSCSPPKIIRAGAGRIRQCVVRRAGAAPGIGRSQRCEERPCPSKSFSAYSEDVARASRSTEPGDPGPC